MKVELISKQTPATREKDTGQTQAAGCKQIGNQNPGRGGDGVRAAAAARLKDADEEEQRDRVICVGKRRDRGGGEAKGGVSEDKGTWAEGRERNERRTTTEKWHKSALWQYGTHAAG
jgi:hypothetical protein